jgi:hypothetical protein
MAGIVSSGLVAHYRGAKANGGTTNNTGSATQWYDISGNARHGTVTNGDEDWLGAGTVGDPYCLSLGGTSGQCALPSSCAPGTGDFTLEVWAYYPTGVSNNYTHLIGYGLNDLHPAYGLNTDNSTAIAFLNTTSNADQIQSSDYSVSSPAWHHIVGTFDRDANAIVYVDNEAAAGVSIASKSADNCVGAPIMGQYDNTWYGQYKFAAVRIYSRVLTPTEVSTNYTAGINGDVETPFSGLTVTHRVG